MLDSKFKVKFTISIPGRIIFLLYMKSKKLDIIFYMFSNDRFPTFHSQIYRVNAYAFNRKSST